MRTVGSRVGGCHDEKTIRLDLHPGVRSDSLRPSASAQVVDKGNEESKAIKAMVEEAVSWYPVFVDPSAFEAMTPHRVLRRRNATRGNQESEGVFVLWVNQGRPEALASIYPWEGDLVHDFASLSRGAKLVVRNGGRVIWSPETPGVEFKDMPGIPRLWMPRLPGSGT